MQLTHPRSALKVPAVAPGEPMANRTNDSSCPRPRVPSSALLSAAVLTLSLGTPACLSLPMDPDSDDPSGGRDGGASGGGSSSRDGGASGGGSSSRDGGASGGGTSGTAGCDGNAKPPTSPRNGYLTIDVKGTTRQYLLELPKGYEGTTPVPVLFAFHGTSSNAQEFIGAAGYGNVSEGVSGRMLIVGPQGLKRGSGLIGWCDFSLPNDGISDSDIDFFDALIAQLKAKYCIDTGRIFAMGHSAGAVISNVLGCDRGDVLRGVGPFNGGGPSKNCPKRMAAFVVHNTDDYLVKWSDTGWLTTKYWTSENGCDPIGAMPRSAYPGNSTTGDPLPCKAFPGCGSDFPVTLCLHSYSDMYDKTHAFPVQWGAKAMADFFLALARVQ